MGPKVPTGVRFPDRPALNEPLYAISDKKEEVVIYQETYAGIFLDIPRKQNSQCLDEIPLCNVKSRTLP